MLAILSFIFRRVLNMSWLDGALDAPGDFALWCMPMSYLRTLHGGCPLIES